MKRLLFLWIILLIIIPEIAAAQNEQNSEDFDYREIDAFLKRSLPEEISFGDTVEELLQGNMHVFLEQLKDRFKQTAVGEIRRQSIVMKQILCLVLTGAVFSAFSCIFKNASAAETGFLILYLILITLLLSAFHSVLNEGQELISRILQFMALIMPIFFMAIAYAGGAASSLALNQTLLLGSSVIEFVFMTVLLPLTELYVGLTLVNYLSKEAFLSRLTDLIRTVIRWSLKTFAGIILGINMVQSLILPYIDSMNTSLLKKAISMIPWIGKGADAAAQAVLGSGVLIKNCIGMGAFIILILLCAGPMLQLGIIALLYKAAAALVQPAADPRILGCLSGVSEGIELVMKILFYTLTLFLITLAVICAATNTGYLAG